MLDFSKSFGSSFLYGNDRERRTYCEDKPLGLFSTVESSTSIEPEVPYHRLLSNTEKDHIEKQIGLKYLRCWTNDFTRLQAILAEKSWVCFDLDDALHEFSRSSGKATESVLKIISQQHGLEISELRRTYGQIPQNQDS